jgi:molybdopterin converting factor small subunit
MLIAKLRTLEYYHRRLINSSRSQSIKLKTLNLDRITLCDTISGKDQESHMSIKVHLYSGLRSQANNQDIVDVKGDNVGECLNDLTQQFPAISPLLFDGHGKMLKNIFVSVNLASAYREQLNQPVKDNDALYLIQIIAG